VVKSLGYYRRGPVVIREIAFAKRAYPFQILITLGKEIELADFGCWLTFM
jgi:hypothetical protein